MWIGAAFVIMQTVLICCGEVGTEPKGSLTNEGSGFPWQGSWNLPYKWDEKLCHLGGAFNRTGPPSQQEKPREVVWASG